MGIRHVTQNNLVSLFGRGGALIFPAISQVDAYWEALRDGRTMPERAEVDPRGLETALPYAFILEHIAPGVGRIRVAGGHLNDLLGMEVRGMPLTSLFAPEARDHLSRTLDAVVSTPQVADISLSATRGIGRPPLPARLLLAPLVASGRSAPQVLGALQSVGKIGRAPRRFSIDQVQTRRIVAVASAGQIPSSSQRAPAMQPGFAEPPRPFGAAEPDRIARRPRRRGRPDLRLVRKDE